MNFFQAFEGTIEVIRLSPPAHAPLHPWEKVGKLEASRERGLKLLFTPVGPD